MSEKAVQIANNKVLMIAYLFPPVGGIGAAGSQRVLKFAKYLPMYHWQPIVLTVHEMHYESYLSLDPSLIEKIPSNLTIIRTPVFRWFSRVLEWQKAVKTRLAGEKLLLTADSGMKTLHCKGEVGRERGRMQLIKDAITDLFEIPDEEIGWMLPSLMAGWRAIKRESIGAIYATGRPWTALVIGAMLRQLTRKLLIVDFRDPWMTNPFRTPYSAVKNNAEMWLEHYVIRKADVVVANTAELKAEFLQRFPHEPEQKFVTLLNGYDADDYKVNEAMIAETTPKQLTITHTGFLYGKRDPKTFLEAVRSVVEKQQIPSQKLQVHFVGSIELPYDLPVYLSSAGLQEIVLLHGQVPYQKSLEFLRRSDVLLLLQPGTTTQIPSKLFEYIGMKKSILAVSPLHGATCQLVAGEQLGIAVDPDDIDSMSNALHTLYMAWEAGSLMTATRAIATEKFDVRQITGSLAALLEKSVPI